MKSRFWKRTNIPTNSLFKSGFMANTNPIFFPINLATNTWYRITKQSLFGVRTIKFNERFVIIPDNPMSAAITLNSQNLARRISLFEKRWMNVVKEQREKEAVEKIGISPRITYSNNSWEFLNSCCDFSRNFSFLNSCSHFSRNFYWSRVWHFRLCLHSRLNFSEPFWWKIQIPIWRHNLICQTRLQCKFRLKWEQELRK